jgi:hexosaminidase
VAWTGGPAAWSGAPGAPGSAEGTGSPLRDRLAAHERRLDAAGVEYRPLDGPRPWQEGGTGPRRHRAGYRVADVVARLDGLATAP